MVTHTDNPYQQRVFAHWDFINRLAKKRFPERGSSESSNLAEEATLYVLNQLEADDWRRIRHYEGPSSFQAFLKIVIQRLLEDFRRQKYGRVRTPDWIRNLGPLWERIYRKLCWERWSRSAVIESLQTMLEPERDPIVLEEIVAAIQGKVIDCGALAAEQTEQRMSDFSDTYPLEAALEAAETASAEKPITAEQRSSLLRVIATWFSASDAMTPTHSSPPALVVALQTLQEKLQFTAEERLLLKLVFQDGISVTDAGQRLGLNANQTHGRLRRLLDCIKAAINASGLKETFSAFLKDEDD